MRHADLSIPRNLGYPPLDAQHQILVDLLMQLEKAIEEGRGDEILAGWLEHVWAYMAAHFAVEDQLMVERGYSGLLEHRKAHDAALDVLRELDSGAKLRVEVVAGMALQFLSQWATTHINGPDRALVQFLRGDKVSAVSMRAT